MLGFISSRRVHVNHPLIGEEMFDLTEELLTLLDMRKMCRVVKCDPFYFGYTIKKGLHCAVLDILF